jgi:hypothetical protein
LIVAKDPRYKKSGAADESKWRPKDKYFQANTDLVVKRSDLVDGVSGPSNKPVSARMGKRVERTDAENSISIPPTVANTSASIFELLSAWLTANPVSGSQFYIVSDHQWWSRNCGKSVMRFE